MYPYMFSIVTDKWLNEQNEDSNQRTYYQIADFFRKHAKALYDTGKKLFDEQPVE